MKTAYPPETEERIMSHKSNEPKKKDEMILFVAAKNNRITARELDALPIKEQHRILSEQSRKMAKHYEVIEDGFDIIDN